MNSMIKKLLSRAVFYIAMFLLIISFNFVIIRLLPGDPLLHILGENEYYYLSQKKPEVLEAMRAEYQLGGSLSRQYVRYLVKTAGMDFGYSYFHAAKVTEVVASRLGWTLLLTVPAIVIAAVIGAALGLACGWRQGKLEKLLTPFFIFLNAVPSYCLGILALFYLAFTAHLFPIGGMASAGTQGFARILDVLWHMVLPVSILTVGKTAYNYLIMKNCVALVKHEDYMLVAKAKGLAERRIIRKHLLKNALLPYMTTVFMQFGYAMSGVMTLEVVFSWKGMGKLVADSALSKDYMVLQLSFLLLCICMMVANMLADLITTWIDPRTKSEDALL